MDIRELDASHRDSVIALWEACGLTRPWNDPVSDFNRAVTGTSSAVLGAFEGEVLVGTVMVGDDGHRGWVYYLASAPERHGDGIGRGLMAAAEEWLRDRGVPKVELMVRASNSEVIGFYEHLGYSAEDVVVMARRL
ncbi:MAG: GNAT family acetyltransferase [bacterium]|nr:GNAT family acetyltransferase [bacterium]